MPSLGTPRLAALAALAAAVAVASTGCGDDEGEDRPGGGAEPIDRILPPDGKVPPPEVSDLGDAVRAAGCRLESSRVESRDHTSSIDERVAYSSNPPTSGRHFQQAAPDGAWGEPPADTAVVHSFEHGRVGIWFAPDLAKRERAQIRALAEEDSTQMLVIPRGRMPYEVAASAWNGDPEPFGTGRLLTCEELTDRSFDALRAFRDEHRGRGPEPIP